MAKIAKNPKVFLDTSVLLSGLNSSSGASFHVLNVQDLDFYISEFVLIEARAGIFKKFSHKITEDMLFSLIGKVPLRVLPITNTREHRRFIKLVEEKDTPILASSSKYCDILLTLDKGILSANGKIPGLRICTPGDLLVEQRAV